jgi:ATP-dependent DNA helicase RecG
MDEAEILRLIADRETDRVERKASMANVDRVCEAICAFANDLPGHGAPGIVAVGVDDEGRPTGLAIDDELLRRLADLRDNGQIYPFPSLTVDSVAMEGVAVAVVVVHPSTSPPVQYRGRTWIRVGPRRAVATPEERRDCTSVAATPPFPSTPGPSRVPPSTISTSTVSPPSCWPSWSPPTWSPRIAGA